MLVNFDQATEQSHGIKSLKNVIGTEVVKNSRNYLFLFYTYHDTE